jgi:hypothetical protein
VNGVLREIWTELLSETSGASGWLSRRVVPEACCPIRAAIGSPTRMPALLLEVAASAVRRVIEYPSGHGFTLAPESISPGPHGAVRLCLYLTDHAYLDQFSALAEDVLGAVVGMTNEDAVVSALLSRLAAWQVFMQRHSDGLSLEEQTGLFAELTFLAEVCHPLLALQALDAWKGPLGGMKDFLVNRTAIEIKATTSTSSTTFHVSNLRQLDDAGLDHLLLCRYVLAQTDTGVSLARRVASVLELFDDGRGGCNDQLHDLLLAAGYSDIHASRYEGRRLGVLGVRYFRIGEGFPRLVPSTVPPGIPEASYSIDMAGCLQHEMTEAAAMQLISPVD